jgi:hypothetical protein
VAAGSANFAARPLACQPERLINGHPELQSLRRHQLGHQEMSDPPKPSITLPQSGRPAQIGRPATSPSLPGQPRAPSGASATSGGLPAAASPDLPKNRGRDWLAGRLKALEHAQTVGLPLVWAHSASSRPASRLTISAVATPSARPAIRPHRRAHPPPSRRRAAAVRPVDCSAKRRLAC